MLLLARIFLCLSVSIFLAAVGAGQDSKRSKRKTTKAAPRPASEKGEAARFPGIITSGGPALPGEVREVGQVTISYDRGENETTVSAASVVYQQPPVLIMLSYSFSVSGKEVVRPEAVEVTADTNGELVFQEGSRLAVEADGKRFDFDPRPSGCHQQQCVGVSARVDFDTFERIANGKSVKIHAGRFTFDLSERGRDAMRDMVRAVDGPAKNP
ncbi:MAG TPA: hypothetical protein VE360_15900 [Pyrinomonadaceae bacterium]|nr:hypothetical protein [Pyrinomonadaceae bacterium]